MGEARRLAAGRYTRSGFFGGSQGGWVAPLAATHVPADFVAVGFGLISSPQEEDRDQIITEMRELGYGEKDIGEATQLADAASRIAAIAFHIVLRAVSGPKANLRKPAVVRAVSRVNTPVR